MPIDSPWDARQTARRIQGIRQRGRNTSLRRGILQSIWSGYQLRPSDFPCSDLGFSNVRTSLTISKQFLPSEAGALWPFDNGFPPFQNDLASPQSVRPQNTRQRRMDFAPPPSRRIPSPSQVIVVLKGRFALCPIMHLRREYLRLAPPRKRALACTRFRRHRVRCFDGTGGGSWRDGSLLASSSLRLCA